MIILSLSVSVCRIRAWHLLIQETILPSALSASVIRSVLFTLLSAWTSAVASVEVELLIIGTLALLSEL